MLILPKFSFANVQNNLPATPTLTTNGTTITAAGSAHTKGAYTDGQIFASTTYDTYLICLAWHSTAATNNQTDMLLDIGIGAAGSESTIISNLLVGWTAAPGTAPGMGMIYLPIYIPAGSRVAARSQAIAPSDTVEVNMWLYQGPSLPPWPVYVGMDAIGVTDSGASAGTSHTPGNSGSESTWASVGSTTGRNYDALFFMVQGTITDTVMTNAAYHWEIGYSSTTICEYLEIANANEATRLFPNVPMPVFIPSGTQLQVRGECSTTAEAHDVALYGLY